MLDFILLFCGIVISLLLEIYIEPLSVYFYGPLSNYMYEYKKSIISTSDLFAICIFLGFYVIFVEYFKYGHKRIWNIVKCILTSVILTFVFTDITKLIVAKPRPSYFNICFGSNYKTMNTSSLLNTKCTCSVDLERDARMSFPSGHASMIFCICMFVSLYSNKFIDKKIGLLKVIMVVFPISVAWAISLTRIHNNMHDMIDVFFGIIIGISSALTPFYFFMV